MRLERQIAPSTYDGPIEQISRLVCRRSAGNEDRGYAVSSVRRRTAATPGAHAPAIHLSRSATFSRRYDVKLERDGMVTCFTDGLLVCRELASYSVVVNTLLQHIITWHGLLFAAACDTLSSSITFTTELAL